MDRFENSSSDCMDGEHILKRATQVRIYEGDEKTYENGDLLLTTHRLLWGSPGSFETANSNCLSLSLSYVIFIEVETPGAFLFIRPTKVVIHLSPSPRDNPFVPPSTKHLNHIKLSFKGGLEDPFVSELKKAVGLKTWDRPSQILPTGKLNTGHKTIKTRTGIVGIERNMHEKQRAAGHSISQAFQDLSRLMGMAHDMVLLSKDISTKIRDRHGEITNDETVQFKSYLLGLGIDDPVTRDSSASESKYVLNLARQVAEILEVPVKEQGGMMSLADAYCRVNRARGLELLSPEDMLAACRHLYQLYPVQIRLRIFDSGVQVLQLSSLTDDSVVKETMAQLELKGTLTAEVVSQKSGISLLLAKERLVTTEKAGEICRDESIEGLRFHPNLFMLKDSNVRSSAT